MKLQRILAKDSRSANEQAIARFGRDVLVVSNSRVNGMTELIVAVEVEPEPTPKATVQQGAGGQFEALLNDQLRARAVAPELPAADAELRPAATMLADRQAQGLQGTQEAHAWQAATAPEVKRFQPAPPVQPPATVIPVLSHYRLPDFLLQTKPSAGLADATPSQPAASSNPDPGEQRARELVAIIREEIAHLRREVHLGQHLRAASAQGPAQVWIDRMADAGMSSNLRTLLMAGGFGGGSLDEVRHGVREQLLANLPKAQRAAFEPGVHMVCGPAGSGKTTMAARLAGIAAQNLGAHRVALVSWRDRRAGAWAQIQLLAAQAGVDAFRAADGATLSMLLADFDPSRVIFVDDGQSRPQNLGDLDAGLSVAHHLVMAADASALTLRQWIANAAPVWRTLFVSRLDHGAQPWPTLEIAAERGLAIAGGSRGPGLADLDLDFSAEALLELALEQWGEGPEPTSVRPASASKLVASAAPDDPAEPGKAIHEANVTKATKATKASRATKATPSIQHPKAAKRVSAGKGAPLAASRRTLAGGVAAGELHA